MYVPPMASIYNEIIQKTMTSTNQSCKLNSQKLQFDKKARMHWNISIVVD